MLKIGEIMAKKDSFQVKIELNLDRKSIDNKFQKAAVMNNKLKYCPHCNAQIVRLDTLICSICHKNYFQN